MTSTVQMYGDLMVFAGTANRRLAEDIETVFLMPTERHSFLSSSLLKEVSRFKADISSFVPSCVARKLRERLRKKK